jgi:hypothetical protein
VLPVFLGENVAEVAHRRKPECNDDRDTGFLIASLL